MLPFLLGGIALVVGKKIYDAVTEDEKVSYYSSNGPTESELRKAREAELNSQREKMTAELISNTTSDINKILHSFKDVVMVESDASNAAITKEVLAKFTHLDDASSSLEALALLGVRLAYNDSNNSEEQRLKRLTAQREALKKLAEEI